jgi:hypothetical protein
MSLTKYKKYSEFLSLSGLSIVIHPLRKTGKTLLGILYITFSVHVLVTFLYTLDSLLCEDHSTFLSFSHIPHHILGNHILLLLNPSSHLFSPAEHTLLHFSPYMT